MRARLFPMLLTGLVLAIIFLLAVQFSQSFGVPFLSGSNNTADASQSEPIESIKPVIIKSVSESENRLTVTGIAHPDVKMSVESSGERLLEFRSDAQGEWRVTLDVDDKQSLQLQFIEELEGNIPTRSDEIVHRIPPPPLDSYSPNAKPNALLMTTAPGGPSSIFQSPFQGLPSSGAISMGSIDYDESGGVIFSGASEKDGRVRILANDVVIGDRRVLANGRWYIIAADTLPRGEFEIKAVLITPDGIDSEITIPFDRLTAQDGDAALDYEVFFEPYTWQIRRALIGGGNQYTAIFAPAEADAIIEK